MDRVLIIDDDKDLLLSFGHLLKKKGYAIMTCNAGEEAMNKIRIFSPDLVVLDVFLNGLDGLTICKKLRNTKYTRELPVIVVSGYPQLSNSATRGYGADAFFSKPFHCEEVENTIRKIITKKRHNA